MRGKDTGMEGGMRKVANPARIALQGIGTWRRTRRHSERNHSAGGRLLYFLLGTRARHLVEHGPNFLGMTRVERV
jgi:hypothetical protein